MKLIDIKQLAEFLSIKEPTLYSWANGGSIPAYKINGVWRFDLDEIKEWVKEGKSLCNPAQKTAIKRSDNQDIVNIVRTVIDGAKGK